MIEHGIPAPEVAKFIYATHGPGSEYVRRPTEWLTRFWGDLLESLELSGMATDHLKLVIVDSLRAEIETVRVGGKCYVVLDQGLTDLFEPLTSASLHALTTQLGLIPSDRDEIPSWEHGLVANRFLSVGLRTEALLQAYYCAHQRGREEPVGSDHDRRDRWVRFQIAFSVAHELAHCSLKGSGDVLARSLSRSFEENLRAYVEQTDVEYPVAPHPSEESEKLARLVLLLADQQREMDPAAEIEKLPAFQWRSRTEQLDWLLAEDSGVGEEVMADHFALSMTARLLADQGESFDECMVAAVQAIRHMFLLRLLSANLTSYNAPPSHADLAKLIEEFNVRDWFAGASAVVFTTRQFNRGEDRNRANADVLRERRLSRVAAALTKTGEAASDLRKTVIGRRHAGRTYRALESEEARELEEVADTDDLDRFLIELTGVGARVNSTPGSAEGP